MGYQNLAHPSSNIFLVPNSKKYEQAGVAEQHLKKRSSKATQRQPQYQFT